MHHQPRSYSYDDEHPHPSAYAGSPPQSQPTSPNFPVHPQDSHRSHYQRPHASSPYYIPPPPHTISPPPAQGTGQYARGASFNSQTQRVAETGYYQAPSHSHSSSAPGYSAHRDSQNHSFIPTPSEVAHSYQSYNLGSTSQGYHTQQSSESQLPGRTPFRPPSSHSSTHQTAPPPSIRSPQPGAASSSTSERYRCGECGKTFSRSHDRKRHHETQHHPVPAVHKCRYCEKEFSRADSLKRHLDNGCDEMMH